MIFRIWCEKENCYHNDGRRPHKYTWSIESDRRLWQRFVEGEQWGWVFDSPMIIEIDLSMVPKRPWVKRRPKI